MVFLQHLEALTQCQREPHASGEVVASADRKRSQRDIYETLLARAHEAVYRLVDRSVAAGRQDHVIALSGRALGEICRMPGTFGAHEGVVELIGCEPLFDFGDGFFSGTASGRWIDDHKISHTGSSIAAKFIIKQ